MSENNSQGSGFGWFLAGIGLGALVGVLYAPKSGRETREEIASNAREGSEYLKARSREAAEQVNTYVERGKAQVNEYVDRGRSHLGEFVDRGKGFLHEQGDRVSAAVDAGKQAYQSSTATIDDEPQIS